MLKQEQEIVYSPSCNVVTIQPESTIDLAAQMMSRHGIGSLVVTDTSGKMVGIVTERDVVNKVVARSLSPSAVQVGEIMTRKVVSCTAHTTVDEAQQIMASHEIRHLPIVQKGEPVGMTSIRDVISHQLQKVTTIARKQYRVLQHLEETHPGITNLPRDRSGRIVL